MATANSEQYAHQAAQHASDAQHELLIGDEHSRVVAQVEMQHALVCAVLALRDTIREGNA